MTRTERGLAGLERTVAGQGAEMARLRDSAFTLKTFHEVMLVAPPAVRALRPRHLYLVGGVS